MDKTKKILSDVETQLREIDKKLGITEAEAKKMKQDIINGKSRDFIAPQYNEVDRGGIDY